MAEIRFSRQQALDVEQRLRDIEQRFGDPVQREQKHAAIEQVAREFEFKNAGALLDAMKSFGRAQYFEAPAQRGLGMNLKGGVWEHEQAAAVVAGKEAAKPVFEAPPQRKPPMPHADIDGERIHVSGLEGGGHLWFLNRSKHPEAPVAPTSAEDGWIKVRVGDVGSSGARGIELTAEERRHLALSPGNAVQVIQQDDAGIFSDRSFTQVRGEPRREERFVTGVPLSLDGPRPDGVDPLAFHQSFARDMNGREEYTLRNVPGQVALMPFKRVTVDHGGTTAFGHPILSEGHNPYPVDARGDFVYRSNDVKPHDAVVVSVRGDGEPSKMEAERRFGKNHVDRAERRVVFAAGQLQPVVVDHPDLGTSRPIQASAGRISLSTNDVRGEPGSATPGSIVVVTDLTHQKKYVTAVRPDGSFERPFDKGLAGDAINVKVVSAFGEKYGDLELGTHKIKGEPVRLEKENTPPVHSNHAGPLQLRFDNAFIGFSTYDTVTGNYGSMGVHADWTGRLDSDVHLDPRMNEVVIRVGVAGEGVREKTHTERSTQVKVDDVQRFRELLPKVGKGGHLPVRFERADGQVVARGRMNVNEEPREHSTGASQKVWPVWMARLDKDSLHYVDEHEQK